LMETGVPHVYQPSIVPMKLCDPDLFPVNSRWLCVTAYFGSARPCPRLIGDREGWSREVSFCNAADAVVSVTVTDPTRSWGPFRGSIIPSSRAATRFASPAG